MSEKQTDEMTKKRAAEILYRLAPNETVIALPIGDTKKACELGAAALLREIEADKAEAYPKLAAGIYAMVKERDAKIEQRTVDAIVAWLRKDMPPDGYAAALADQIAAGAWRKP